MKRFATALAVSAMLLGSAGTVAAQHHSPARQNHIGHSHTNTQGSVTSIVSPLIAGAISPSGYSPHFASPGSSSPYTAGVFMRGGYSPYTAGMLSRSGYSPYTTGFSGNNNGNGGFTPSTMAFPGWNSFNATGATTFGSGTYSSLSGRSGR